MNEKVKRHHLERTPYLYVRQSSPNQVRNNPLGLTRQLDLAPRATELGWAEHSLKILQDDLGQSGSSMANRAGLKELLRAVQAGEAGIIIAAEASRLARENLDFQLVVRYCKFHDVLFADHSQVYDPNDSRDKMFLGIQGVLAEYELNLIWERMQTCWWEKAEEGKLFPSIPSGYVLEAEQLIKHPHERVQDIYDFIFRESRRFPSARQFWKWFIGQGHELPIVPHGEHYSQVEWKAPSYERIRDLLQNPAYAGVYVIGRTRTEESLDESGHRIKRRVRVPMDEWKIVIQDSHEGYIDYEVFLDNYTKIAMNSNRTNNGSPGAPREGESLLQGIVRCGRCGRTMAVRYSKKGAPSYRCPRHVDEEGQPSSGCFQFAATRPEQTLVQAILDIVRPAGVEIAARAAADLSAQHQSRRQVYLDRLQDLEYQAERARRQFDKVEPENRQVAKMLESRLEEKLTEVAAQKEKLQAFDRQHTSAPTPKQRHRLEELSCQLEQVWLHPKADNTLKTQIVRILVQEVIANIDDETNEIQLIVHWSGGHHTEYRLPRRERKPKPSTETLKTVIDLLRLVENDEAIARTLNRSGVHTAKGETWKAARVTNFRKQHSIPQFNASEKEASGYLTQHEAATRLGISPMSVHRLIKRGIMPVKQPIPDLPFVIEKKNLDCERVKRAVKHIKNNLKAPLPDHPEQLSLFPTTKS